MPWLYVCMSMCTYLCVCTFYTIFFISLHIFTEKATYKKSDNVENVQVKKAGDKKGKRRPRFQEEEEEEEGLLRDITNVPELLAKAKEGSSSHTPKRPRLDDPVTLLDNEGKVDAALVTRSIVCSIILVVLHDKLHMHT